MRETLNGLFIGYTVDKQHVYRGLDVIDGRARDKELLIKLGECITWIRKSDRLSRQQLADATGMSLMAITYIENGERWPRISNLEKIATVLDVSIGDLFHKLEPKK